MWYNMIFKIHCRRANIILHYRMAVQPIKLNGISSKSGFVFKSCGGQVQKCPWGEGGGGVKVISFFM